jgi:hypothetical protein
LENARTGLLQIHRALIAAERVRYERQHGRIENSGALLQLVLHDPWFYWLRPMTDVIVQIDDWLDQDLESSGSPELAGILLTQVRDRLRPGAEGTEFQQRYHRLLQENPAVAVAHAEVRKLISA